MLKRVGKLITDSRNSVSRFGELIENSALLPLRGRRAANFRAGRAARPDQIARVHIPPIMNDHKEN